MHLGAALIIGIMEVELPIGLGGFTAYQPLMNSECHDIGLAEMAIVTGKQIGRASCRERVYVLV